LFAGWREPVLYITAAAFIAPPGAAASLLETSAGAWFYRASELYRLCDAADVTNVFAGYKSAADNRRDCGLFVLDGA
jgi:hypothetical protein